ncbi:MAG: hypothetical protein LH609_10645 [Rudanella sp.]|nr:hypothetical protein [Rudanella sp.]
MRPFEVETSVRCSLGMAWIRYRLTRLWIVQVSRSYRVIVWDFDTKQVLRQKTIEQTAPDKLTMNDIESLALTANKKYVISVNSQSGGTNKKYAYAYKTGGGEFMPFTKGSILIYNACYRNTATALFPDTTPNIKSELYGYPEFTFIPD